MKQPSFPLNFRPKHWDQLLQADNPMEYLKQHEPHITKNIQKQDRLCKQYFKSSKPLINSIYNEIVGRIQKSDLSPYSYYGSYIYQTQYLKTDNYPRFLQKKLQSYQSFQVILNCNDLAKDTSYFTLKGLEVSKCGQWLAYAIDVTGSQQATLFLKHIPTNTITTIHTQASGSCVLIKNRLYFVTLNQQHHPDTLWCYHRDTKSMDKIYHEPDPSVFMSIGLTSDERYLVLDISGHGEAEIWVADTFDESYSNNNKTDVGKLDDKNANNEGTGGTGGTAVCKTGELNTKIVFKQILWRQPSIEYATLDHVEGYFYLLTNQHCKNFHVLRAESKTMDTNKNQNSKDSYSSKALSWHTFLPNTSPYSKTIFSNTTSADKSFPKSATVLITKQLTIEQLLIEQLLQATVLYEDILFYQDFFVLQKLKGAIPTFEIYTYNKERIYQFTYHEPCYDLSLLDLYDFHDKRVAYSVSSPKTPPCVYELHVDNLPIEQSATEQSANKKSSTEQSSTTSNTVLPFLKILKQQKVANYISTDYETEFHYIPSHDGKAIPVSLVYKKQVDAYPQDVYPQDVYPQDDYPKKTVRPLVLYSYGAYGYTESEHFSSSIISLLDRGVVWVTAHVRGGMDMGYDWYLDGKGTNKLNTFFDIISTAKWLIKQKRTDPKHLLALGRSAGGMTIGYLANNASHLFKAFVAEVPFVDCIHTMQDASLPLTPPEWNEWGNPITDPIAYAYIKTYSPLDHISDQNYPSLYAATGLTDSQVGFWEPLEWITKIQQHNTGTNPIILDITDKGHQGKSGRFISQYETARIYSFIIQELI